MSKKVKLYWSRQPTAPDWEGNTISGGLDCYIRRNGRFYGFLRIRKTPGHKRWWIEVLIPHGVLDWNPNGFNSLREAKAGGRKIVETILADMQGVSLL